MSDLINITMIVGLFVFAIVGYIHELRQEKEYRREQRSLQYEFLDHLRTIAQAEKSFYIKEKKYEHIK